MYSVLYVDDEEVLLGLNKIYLEKGGEFSVDTSLSAMEGLKKIHEHSYDAVISDYDMPHMDGLGFLKEVRSRHGNLPFLLFTGKGREEVVIEAVDNGVDYYIQKGHDMQGMIAELRYKIKRAIERRRIIDELEKSRQQMTDIINFLPDATFVRDIHGRVIAWNHAMEQMTGVRSEDILGKGDYEYALPFYHEKCPVLADLVLHEDPVTDPRYRYFERNGDKIISEVFIPHFNNGNGADLWITASPLYDTYGSVSGAIASFRDITASCAVKRDLTTTQDMIQGFADIMPVAIFEMDLSSNLTFSNRIGYEWFGLNRDDADQPICILAFIAPQDRERAVEDLRQAIGGKKSTGQEYLLVRKDESTFPALIYGAKIGDPETGEPTGVRGVIIDITERKKEAQELNESRERLDLALNAGDTGIWDVDMRTLQIRDVYGWASRTLGLHLEDPQSITFNSAQSLVHPLDMPRAIYAFYQHISGKKPLFETELRLSCADGSWKWVSVRGKAIERDANNQPARITGTVNEITLPKK